MVKFSEAKKRDLIDLLNAAANSKERNKIVKQLKKFDPCPRRELDDNFDAKDCTCKKYNQTQYYMCWRCDKPKTTNVKVMWNSPKVSAWLEGDDTCAESEFGLKIICNTCYFALHAHVDLLRARKDNAQYYGFFKKA